MSFFQDFRQMNDEMLRDFFSLRDINAHTSFPSLVNKTEDNTSTALTTPQSSLLDIGSLSGGFDLAVKCQDDSQLVLEGVVPEGFTKKDVTMQMDGDLLTIKCQKGDRNEQRTETSHSVSSSSSSCMRTIRLPQSCNTDADVKAKFKNGKISITIPKKCEQIASNTKQINFEE